MMAKVENLCPNEIDSFVLMTPCLKVLRETVCHTILGIRFVEYWETAMCTRQKCVSLPRI